MFISFEGGEGAGKTTQARLLTQYLISHNISCIQTKEPGNTHVGKVIKEKIYSKDLDVKTELLLLLADRNEHLNNTIIPALKQKRVVVCDRFIDSTLCYQGLLKRLGIKLILEIHKVLFKNIFPDVTFLIDTDVSVSLKRLDSRGYKNSYDLMSKRQHKKIKEGFLEIANLYPNRIKLLSGNKNYLEIHKEIIESNSIISLLDK